MGLFIAPNSVKAVTPLVGRILMESEALRGRDEVAELHLFSNRPKTGAVFTPVSQRLLPLDDHWRRRAPPTTTVELSRADRTVGSEIRTPQPTDAKTRRTLATTHAMGCRPLKNSTIPENAERTLTSFLSFLLCRLTAIRDFVASVPPVLRLRPGRPSRKPERWLRRSLPGSVRRPAE
jgi:hypothetical protein